MENGIFIDPTIIWNLLISLILVPVGYLVRNLLSEVKRQDILINKTREEIAKDYVTRDELEKTMDRLMDAIDRIDEKIDRLQTKTYFQD